MSKYFFFGSCPIVDVSVCCSSLCFHFEKLVDLMCEILFRHGTVSVQFVQESASQMPWERNVSQDSVIRFGTFHTNMDHSKPSFVVFLVDDFNEVESLSLRIIELFHRVSSFQEEESVGCSWENGEVKLLELFGQFVDLVPSNVDTGHFRVSTGEDKLFSYFKKPIVVGFEGLECDVSLVSVVIKREDEHIHARIKAIRMSQLGDRIRIGA